MKMSGSDSRNCARIGGGVKKPADSRLNPLARAADAVERKREQLQVHVQWYCERLENGGDQPVGGGAAQGHYDFPNPSAAVMLVALALERRANDACLATT